MFNWHIFIYTKHGYWSTHVLNIRANEVDVIKKCDIVFLCVEPMVFSELKCIRKPFVQVRPATGTDHPIPSPQVNPKNTSGGKVMPNKTLHHKHPNDKYHQKRKCTNRGQPEWTPTTDPPPQQNDSCCCTVTVK